MHLQRVELTQPYRDAMGHIHDPGASGVLLRRESTHAQIRLSYPPPPRMGMGVIRVPLASVREVPNPMAVGDVLSPPVPTRADMRAVADLSPWAEAGYVEEVGRLHGATDIDTGRAVLIGRMLATAAALAGLALLVITWPW